MVQLIQSAYSVRSFGNIVFVCGGNDPEHLRTKFVNYAKASLPEFVIFLPEFAMNSYFSGEAVAPFDIVDFEILVAELSHAIVIFPEAPGSFAETGYFSAIEKLSLKTILVMDSNRQKDDSFLSLGPERKINQSTAFHPTLKIDYKNPDFDLIVKRLKRTGFSRTKKALSKTNLVENTAYERICILYKIVDLLSVATVEDVIYISKSLSRGKFQKKHVIELTSILVGSGYIIPVGEFGHYRIGSDRVGLLETMTGKAEDETTLKLELALQIERGDPDFKNIASMQYHVA